MPEKNKWFDPKPVQLPVITPILTVSQEFTAQGLQEFLHALETGKHLGAAGELFRTLSLLPPAYRLCRNLKVLVSLMGDGEVESVILDGLSKGERNALYCLERSNCDPQIREAAQSLLNVYERYQLMQSLGPAFRQARRKKHYAGDT